MGGKPGGDHDFAMPRPQRVQNAIDKAERQQRPPALVGFSATAFSSRSSAG
jgi:hypothetical protein